MEEAQAVDGERVVRISARRVGRSAVASGGIEEDDERIGSSLQADMRRLFSPLFPAFFSRSEFGPAGPRDVFLLMAVEDKRRASTHTG